MRKSAMSGGYTIVEVLIFLLVSGMMLAMAMWFMSGRQGRTQFSQSVNDLDSRIRSIINDINNGYYPFNQVKCTVTNIATDATTRPLLMNSAATTQGTNNDCIFIGKVIQFDATGKFRIYTVVGRRYIPGSFGQKQEVRSLSEAKPEIVAPNTLPPSHVGNPLSPDITELGSLTWATTINKMFINDATNLTPVEPTGALGIFTNFASYSGGNLSGSADSTVLAALASPGSQLGMDQNHVGAMVASLSTGALTKGQNGIGICLQSSGSKQKAVILIGGRGRQTDTQVFFDTQINTQFPPVGGSGACS